VRPITVALDRGWPLRALLYHGDRALSGWARGVLDRADPSAERVALAGPLLAELGEKDEAVPELVAVAALPADDLGRISGSLVVLFDRPTSPGNIGTLIRSADAFGATGVIISGHGADPYDPRAVRASAGSLFGPPVVRVPGPREVLDWTAQRYRLIATDEHGDVDISTADLTGPVILLIGNETNGLAATWRDACDLTVRIPITGTASSLNAAGAATAALYEYSRQRRLHRGSVIPAEDVT
jgi:TrmH family RNA methyltransferase